MESIKCMCNEKGDCPMYLNVSNESDDTIWLEIEDVSVNPLLLAKRLKEDAKDGDLVKTRVPFALDMNGAFALIRKLQNAIINQLTDMP